MLWRHVEGVEIWGVLTASRAGAVVAHSAAQRPLAPVRARVRAQVAAALAAQSQAKPRHGHVVAVTLHVDHALVVATAPQAPRGERAHAVRAHVVGAPHSLPQVGYST